MKVGQTYRVRFIKSYSYDGKVTCTYKPDSETKPTKQQVYVVVCIGTEDLVLQPGTESIDPDEVLISMGWSPPPLELSQEETKMLKTIINSHIKVITRLVEAGLRKTSRANKIFQSLLDKGALYRKRGGDVIASARALSWADSLADDNDNK